MKRRNHRRPEPKPEPSRAEKIKAAWETAESNEPDISTERLYAMVMDMTGASYGEITDVVAE
ncbi:MAG: hypothetical protein JWP57_4406 [Spirosoma sp.]|nr:hypothetical protein [Spirosoma sp.]